ncbi:FHA domain-containing protein [Streptomyces sp. 184]|uniref:FHA domain-containing protein n=1 Tax=Streptomyces sp. 184 TaxID=1827526 RepID=UPI003891F18A
MQIRLTVQATRGGAAARGRDVIVTAPAGTTLGAVAGGLLDAAAAAASGGGGTASGTGGAGVAVYAGQRLLDPDRILLGEPPLVDGAVLSLGGPADPGHGQPPEADAAAVTSLRVVAGPDAGGVHLLHGGQIRIGRSADADVPLDDPDVSRLHCALTVTSDGRVTVEDLGSTNGTTVDGRTVGRTPVPLPADAVLRVGESALRIASPAGAGGAGSGRTGAGAAEYGGGPGPGAGSGSSSAEHSRVPEQRLPQERGATTTGLGGGWPAGGGPEYGGGGAYAADEGAEDAGRGGAEAGFDHGRERAGRPGGAGGARSGKSPSGAGTGQGPGAEPGSGRPGRRGAGRQGTDTGTGNGPGGADPTHGGGAVLGDGDGHARGARGSGYGEGHDGRGTGAESGRGDGHRAADRNDPSGTNAGHDRNGPGAAPGHGASDRGGPSTGAGPAHGDGRPARDRGRARTGADPGHGDGHSAPDRSGPPAGPGPGHDGGAGAGRGAPGAGGARGAGTGAGRARGRAGAEGGSGPDNSAVRRGTPTRGTVVPPELRPRGDAAGAARPAPAASVPQPPRRGIRAWARRLGGREDGAAPAVAAPAAARTVPERIEATDLHDRYPDAAAILLAALSNEAAYRPGFLYSPDDRPGDTRPHHTAHPEPGGRPGAAGGRTDPGAPAGIPAQPGTPGPGAPAGKIPPGATPAGPAHPYPGAAAHAPVPPGTGAPSSSGATARSGARGTSPGDPGGQGLVFRRGAADADALVVRLGTEFRPGGSTVPVTVDLRRAGSLALAGPRPRLAGLARSVVAQLAALHGPDALELVLIAADPTRAHESRVEDWSWAGWLPHVRPRQGQDCRLLLAYDREQAAARVGELQRRLEQPVPGARSVVVVDGDPGTAAVRDAVARLAERGPAAGVHVVCLAETAPATPASPLTATYDAAREAAPGFAACGAVGLLSGDVATGLRLLQRPPAAAPDAAPVATEPGAPGSAAAPGRAEPPAAGPYDAADPGDGSSPATAYGTGRARLRGDGIAAPAEPAAAGGWFEVAASGQGSAGPAGTVDAVSAAWAERLARALAPYGERDDGDGTHPARRGGVLPGAVRLLDELDLARATPTALTARWLESRSGAPRVGAVLGAGPAGRLVADLAAGPLAVEGAAGGGKSELLRSFAAALAAGEPPERLQLVLVDGAGRERGDALGAAADLPHVSGYLVAADPVRMRDFAQELGAEFKRRAALYAPEGEAAPQGPAIPGPRSGGEPRPGGAADVQAPQSNTLRLRPRAGSGEAPGPGAGAAAGAVPGTDAASRGTSHPPRPGTTPPHGTPAHGTATERPGATPAHGNPAPRRGSTPPHGTPAPGGAASPARSAAAPAGRRSAPPAVVVLVDDYDALVAPALGSPARPAAGSVVRVVEAIARDGGPLGIHLVTASAQPEATAATAAVSGAAHHVVLGGDDVPPGRGLLCGAGAEPVPFQAARVTGRIPRTATARPTVVPLEWARMGSPPTSRPLRELGNGPTDLALLASALQRAAGTAAAPTGDTRSTSP